MARVLVATSASALAEVVAGVLRRAGHCVCTASTGGQALALLTLASDRGVAVLDSALPGPPDASDLLAQAYRGRLWGHAFVLLARTPPEMLRMSLRVLCATLALPIVPLATLFAGREAPLRYAVATAAHRVGAEPYVDAPGAPDVGEEWLAGGQQP